MYAEQRVKERLRLAEDELRMPLAYHSVSQVEEFEQRLHEQSKYVLGETGKPIGTRNLTNEDAQWMVNEQALVTCDAAYFLTRYCNPPEAPIWMGDLTFKSLGNIQVGDVVMGWKRYEPSGRSVWKKGSDYLKHGMNNREFWVKSEVIAISKRTAPIVKVVMESGKVIRCTSDHLWSSGNGDRTRRPWISARVGQWLRRVVDVYSNQSPDPIKAAWLAGIYDGEGSGVSISQQKSHNPDVYQKIIECLRDLGFAVGAQANDRTISINGGISERSRFVTQCNPVRRRSMEKYIFKRLHAERDRVLSVEPDGEGEVISMQTETGNYVAWGYASKNCYLRDEEGVIKRFSFRVPQRLYFDIICDLEAMAVAIEILALKARQLGVSIFSELLISHRSIFSYGANAIIGSADQTKTSEMSRMMFLCYDMLPVWLRPQHTSRVESDRGKILFGDTVSGISFQHGSQKFGIGTGTTPNIYHLSEVALYGEAAQMLIDEGLWKAVHASDRVFGVLESTGRGDKGWWADTWRYSKKNWPRCRMYPMFLPWFCGVDIYPKPAWLKMRPIPSDWRPKRDTRQHVAKSELYVRSTPLLNRHLVAYQHRTNTLAPDGLWRMPREQQWFWEVNYEEAKAKGFVSSFLQEMAGDDIEALQHSEESVFGHETIAEIDTRRTRQYQCYGLSGQSIEDAHEPPPEDIDYRRERIPIRYASPKGEVYRWELIPLSFRHELDESNPEDAIGKFIVFHPPAPGKSYSIGVDTSEGKGEDSTVISVWECGSKGSPDIQCAEFASPYVSHVEAFSFVLCIAAYYGQYMESGVTRWKQPYVAIEQVAAVGDTCQLQMRKMGYSNFHRMTRYDGKRVSKSRAVKLGWYTFSWSRPLLTGNFVHAAQNGWAEINSPWLLDEMKHFEVHVTSTGKEKLEHEEGEHDDRIFAAAMAIFCPHDMDVLADRSKKRTVEEAGLPRLDTRPYAGQVITAAQMRQPLETLEDIVYSEPLRRH